HGRPLVLRRDRRASLRGRVLARDRALGGGRSPQVSVLCVLRISDSQSDVMTSRATKPAPSEHTEHATWPRRLRLVALVLLAATAGALVQGNIALIGMSWLARATTDLNAGPDLDGVRKLYTVDARVWRGAQPGAVGFRSLAANGVTTVVDLRPGSDARKQDGD